MSFACHMTSDSIDKACDAYNSLGSLEDSLRNTLRDYFNSIFENTGVQGYENAVSYLDPRYFHCIGRRSVETEDNERILYFKVRMDQNSGTETSFFYYRSRGKYAYFVRDESNDVVEVDEREMSYRIIENGNTYRINNI